MAERDRSQGFGFMYVDITKLLADKAKLEHEKPVLTQDVKTANFNKDEVKPKETTGKVIELQKSDKTNSIKQIKENLDRLQSLHHKLHAMLEEIDKSTKNGNNS